jgi:acetoacetyl-CoA synthetase
MKTVPIPQLRLYQDWLRDHRGIAFDSYDALRQWSVTDLSAYWQSIWDYFELRSPTPHRAVLSEAVMPGAKWFEGAKVNFARQVFRHVDAAHAADCPALICHNEEGRESVLGWPELRQQAASMALHLRAQGVQPGDRVAAYLPNVPETIVAFLAVVSIGAIWSVCAPDMGAAAVLDRFRQIEPKVLIACDGFTFGGQDFERTQVVAQLCADLPSVRHLIVFANLGAQGAALPSGISSVDLRVTTARNDSQTDAFEPDWLPFDHPLWIVYSSGTTGLPKPIVHGHGGAVIVGLTMTVLHMDVGSSYDANTRGERYHWYSSTGWVLWNAQTSGLLNGTTCCLYDGSPNGSKERPDWTTLWRFAGKLGLTFFGAGAAFYVNCMKAGLDLAAIAGLRSLRTLGSTGSPLPPEAQRWGTSQLRQVMRDDPAMPEIWWCNVSGGTDFAGAFIGGNRELEQIPGEIQCRLLGYAVEVWDDNGQPLIDEVGELVCTQPVPSMPLYFWGDKQNARYLSSYFDTYPGVWRHGDWLRITPRGGCIVYGRSDATINRHGHRMGTSELYSAVEGLPEVLDSLVVDLEYLGRESYMPLFVVLRPGLALDDAMTSRIKDSVRQALSPRFVPDEVFQVAEIPRTLTGKKQELPIKKLLLGQPLEQVLNRDAMVNPGCLAWYVDFARQCGALSRET